MFDGIDAGSWGEIIVGVVAIIVGVYVVVRWQVEKRKIAYQIRTNSIIRVDGVHSDEIEIKFKGTEVKTLKLFSITIKNLGNRPILKADWENPIEISFNSKETKILDIKTASSYPSGLEISALIYEKNERATVIIEPILLNSKEGFKLQFVTSGFFEYTMKARFVGISDMTNFDQEKNHIKNFIQKNPLILVLTSLINAALYVTVILYDAPFDEKLNDPLLATISLSIIFLILWGGFSQREQRLDEKFVEK